MDELPTFPVQLNALQIGWLLGLIFKDGRDANGELLAESTKAALTEVAEQFYGPR